MGREAALEPGGVVHGEIALPGFATACGGPSQWATFNPHGARQQEEAW